MVYIIWTLLKRTFPNSLKWIFNAILCYKLHRKTFLIIYQRDASKLQHKLNIKRDYLIMAISKRPQLTVLLAYGGWHSSHHYFCSRFFYFYFIINDDFWNIVLKQFFIQVCEMCSWKGCHAICSRCWNMSALRFQYNIEW